MVDRSPVAEIRILGPLGVTGPPAAALGGPRQRSLLVLLAVNLGCPISRDRIIDAIWSDPPPSAVSTIQGYVSHLRRAFEGHPVGIDFSGGAYVLVGDVRLVDASRFEAATAKASLLLRSDRERDVRDALTTVEAALALWRGPALDGFLDAPFAHPEATRLEQRRIEAGALRARALLELGRSADAIGALEPLVEEQPYDEEL
ncbi:MAG TPA: BTAD domain-containing putative transcriptional regulator, partial [Verrucomicrobiae bacterium]|nr:BTAD domain-containing putative transcriptional regulator [Verrucomicrobiae bacterium]